MVLVHVGRELPLDVDRRAVDGRDPEDQRAVILRLMIEIDTPLVRGARTSGLRRSAGQDAADKADKPTRCICVHSDLLWDVGPGLVARATAIIRIFPSRRCGMPRVRSMRRGR